LSSAALRFILVLEDIMSNYKVMIVEDDQNLQRVIEYNLKKEGYAVATAADGVQAVETARGEKPDFIILDIMLPGMSGYEVCRILRQSMTTPILMLTARGEETDKVVGLDMGADDYMTKPFSMRELLARVRAGLRRIEMVKGEVQTNISSGPQTLQAGEFLIDLSRHSATKAGVPLDLNPKEFDLIVFLMRNPGQVFNRDTLLEKVWGYDYAGDTRTVDVHMRWLRQKIETDPDSPKHLLTVRGVGYKFEE
jgi:two-component system, OmpR family, response regulator